MNRTFKALRIPVEIKKARGVDKVERPGLTGAEALALVAAGPFLVDKVSWTDRVDDNNEIQDAQHWKEMNLRLWRQWKWIVDALAVVNHNDLTEEQVHDFGKHCRRFPIHSSFPLPSFKLQPSPSLPPSPHSKFLPPSLLNMDPVPVQASPPSLPPLVCASVLSFPLPADYLPPLPARSCHSPCHSLLPQTLPMLQRLQTNTDTAQPCG